MIMFSTVMGEWHEHWLTLRGEGVGVFGSSYFKSLFSVLVLIYILGCLVKL